MECPTPAYKTNTTERWKRDLEEFVDDLIGSIDELIKVIEQTTKNTFIQQDPNDQTSRGTISDDEARLAIGFIMDGVQDLLRWSDHSQVNMKYVADPEYELFDNDKATLSGRVLQLHVSMLVMLV